jgi:hypothetical protein
MRRDAGRKLTNQRGQRRLNVDHDGQKITALRTETRYRDPDSQKISVSMVVKPKNIDAYLASVSDDKRAALKRVRRIIRAAVPNAEECMGLSLSRTTYPLV